MTASTLTFVLYTMRSSATESTPLGLKTGSAFSPASTTPALAAVSRTCTWCAVRVKMMILPLHLQACDS